MLSMTKQCSVSVAAARVRDVRIDAVLGDRVRPLGGAFGAASAAAHGAGATGALNPMTYGTCARASRPPA